jgi:hypothetical protein
MVGILGSSGNSPLSLATFDSSVLTSYYASGVNLGETLHAKKIQKEILDGVVNLDESVIPPWTLPDVQTTSSEEALAQIFSSGNLIDLTDPRVVNHGDDENFKNLFALYNGLSKMRELVSFAESDATATSYSSLLQTRFEGYLSEVKDFTTGLNFSDAAYDATLLYGVRETTMTSSVSFPKSTSNITPYHIGAVASTVRDDPIAGLTGTETFDVTAVSSSGTTVVNINLADISGTLNVDNIAAHINSELSAAGVLSTIKVKRFSEDAYGFEFNPSSIETISFGNATGTSPAVYIAGTNNVGDASSGFVKKLDDLSNTAPNEVFRSDIDTTAADSATSVAVDSQGYVYTVGTTAGDLEGQTNQASTDAYLRKYDAAGNLVWSRLLGATDQASGFAVAVDADDNVVIAGQTLGQLSETAYGGNYDSFVTKFNSSGIEQWTRQAAPYANDGALALTTDTSGNVFIAGYTQGAIDGSATFGGATDGYVTKLDSSGNLQWNQQFGGTGSDRAAAITVDNAGNVFVAGSNDGSAVVRKYADAGTSASLTWEADAGTLNSDDAVTGIALGSDGAVYLSGNTSNAALNGTIVQAHNGGTDGFVTKIADAGASASVGYTSYIGSSGEDTIGGVAVLASSGADEIYVTGGTTGGIDGSTAAVSRDLYAAKLDNAGATAWTEQFRGTFTHSGNAIAFNASGTDVLSRLGLPTGTISNEKPSEVTALTSARAGQSFRISVNGGAERTVTIEADDSLGFLAYKIKKILGTEGKVTIEDGIDSKTMTIEATNGGVIELIAGQEGFDALSSLGLREGTLYGESADVEKDNGDSIFELGLFDTLDISTKQGATDAGIIIDNALREIRSIFRYITVGPEDDEFTPPVSISAADSEKIANLQSTLSFVTSLAQSANASNSSSSNSLFGLVV